MALKSRPQKTALLIAQRIVTDISESGMQPGDRLPPEHVMLEEYGVGRGTLRESLRFLELQGVIQLKPGPNGGPIIREPDSTALTTSLMLSLELQKAPFQTILETRIALEPEMVRLAAERMSDDQIKELREIVEAEADNINDGRAFLLHAARFHSFMAACSGNAIFRMLFDALVGIMDGASMGVEYQPRHRQATVDVHRAILDAIEARDPEAAERLMASQMAGLTRFTKRRYAETLKAPIVWRD